ncbi:MAG TPA: ATP-binding protein, partial [Trueperaceae bacterium]|nr:ATP-binding protein [Trueperaceae bacterium]
NRALLPVPRPKATRRDIHLPDIPGKVHAVIGMRRAGKTTFLKQLQADGRVENPPERAIYLSFDDDRLADLDVTQLDLLLEEYYRRHPDLRDSADVHWFLDDVQLVDGWERFVRRVSDTERVRFVVSGSSAKMLSREVHTSLRGRSVATVVSPFSFREYLRHREVEPKETPEHWTPATRSLIEAHFRAYMRAGGFPEAQGLETRDRIPLLQGYVDSVLLRDVVERYDVSQVGALRWLVRFLLRNPAGKISVRKLTDDISSQGHAVGRDTVGALLEHVTDAFLVALVPLATESDRRQSRNPLVAYPVDTGLVQAFDASGRPHTGHTLETAVFNELNRRGRDVSYVKNPVSSSEVDFLSRDYEGSDELIQVCAEPTVGTTLARELRALDEALPAHRGASAIMLVTDRDEARRFSHPNVTVSPAYEWLLAEPSR